MTTHESVDPAGYRRLFVEHLRSQLVGPAGGDDEVLTDPPDRRYLMGTLYPRGADLHSRAARAGEDENNETAATSDDEDAHSDDPVAEANAWLPSSLGFSLYTDASEIVLTWSAARFDTVRIKGRRTWPRIPLPQEAPAVLALDRSTSIEVLDGRARLHVRSRRFGDGWLVTCALANAAEEGSTQDDWDHMLFQVELSAEVHDGRILEYPNLKLRSKDLEEQELRLQYRHAITYAVGHGCAVTWTALDGIVTRVAAEVMPTKAVPHTRPGGPVGLPITRMMHLATGDLTLAEARIQLNGFVGDYRRWYDEQVQTLGTLPAWTADPGGRITSRIDDAITRMSAGVAALTGDADAWTAFRLANHAMALQIRRTRPDLAGERRSPNEAVPLDVVPDLDASWHPFQLAFFLLVCSGLVTPDTADRDVVDLLWFPTGGGKTEAYLLLAAFEICLRRLRHRTAGGGTVVLSRYTLSLLTTQQFQRTASTICALEYLRRFPKGAPEADRLGSEPISVGLWVGMSTTPNSYGAAKDGLGELLASNEPDDRFLLERCPWCGAAIIPDRKDEPEAYGIRAEASSFQFFCPRPDCEFHDELPVLVIDEDIYDRPPTFLLGTVDKFARLAHEPRAGRIFGTGTQLAPSLVIQDELHLLTGPLGTIVGLYEAAVLDLCSRSGRRPKVIASTATIRRAGEQIRKLYGRDLQLFPPPGIDARDSFFAKQDTEKPGRMYVGVMAQGHTASTATVHTCAALLQAPMVIEPDSDPRDAYWTLVAYHNSLRELGRTVSLARDDIPARLTHLAQDRYAPRALDESAVEELTSNVPRSAQPKLLLRLGRDRSNPDAISFLATTNMLSVGVDVPRLGLMLMNGQPKATAEYIQATSRVGRGKTPGVVVTQFQSTKPRDRSHYETFDAYHSSLYRHIEPVSVTPWSVPARKRALAAVLITMVRHRVGLAADAQAAEIAIHRAAVAEVCERIIGFAHAADPSESRMLASELRDLVAEWEQAAETAAGEGRKLYYRSNGKGQSNLICDFGDTKGGQWVIPQSMRNVDFECLVSVAGTGTRTGRR